MFRLDFLLTFVNGSAHPLSPSELFERIAFHEIEQSNVPNVCSIVFWIPQEIDPKDLQTSLHP